MQPYRRILPRTPNQDTTALVNARAAQLPVQVAVLPAHRQAKTSSERGKAFRARQRIRKAEVHEQVDLLRDEISRLVARKSLLQATLLQRRESSTGSLARLAREYYTLFQHGMGDRRRAMMDPVYAARTAADVAYKENFLRSVMVEDAVTGDLVGPDASLMQWHFFCTAHSHLTVTIERIDVVGPHENPFVEVHASFALLVGPQALALMSPGSEQNPRLVHIFQNRRVTFPVTTRFQFGHDGRICYEQVRTNLVEGYLRSGIAMEDIAAVLQNVVVSTSLTVDRDTARSATNVVDTSVISEEDGGSTVKLAIDYLLASNELDDTECQSTDDEDPRKR